MDAGNSLFVLMMVEIRQVFTNKRISCLKLHATQIPFGLGIVQNQNRNSKCNQIYVELEKCLLKLLRPICLSSMSIELASISISRLLLWQLAASSQSNVCHHKDRLTSSVRVPSFSNYCNINKHTMNSNSILLTWRQK